MAASILSEGRKYKLRNESMKVINVNVHMLIPKMLKGKDAVHEKQPNILCIMETKLNIRNVFEMKYYIKRKDH